MSEPLQPGDFFLEKYRIERLVGQGAMGAVYAAMDVDLARRVAIKVLLPRATNTPQAESRFINEARAAARIEGEHVARVFAAGRAPNGPAYMVLELLEGSDLRGLLSRCGRLAIEDAVDILLETLEAISEAHHHGIVHRDLKPENIFLARRSDGTAFVKVLDFGISKTNNPFTTSDSEHALTSTRALLGSPLYMAPEQLRNAKNVDGRADIWSLGVILYEALTGRHPFRGETLGELLASILEGKPFLVGDERPELPDELQVLIHRCLAPDPRHRFGDTWDLARELMPFALRSRTSLDRIRRFADVPSRAMPRTEERPLVRKATRHANRSGLMLLLAIPVAFIVGGCIVVFFLFVRPKAEHPIVASPPCTESPPLVTAASEKEEPPVEPLAAASTQRETPAPPRHRASSRPVAAVPEKLEPDEAAPEAAFEPLGASRH